MGLGHLLWDPLVSGRTGMQCKCVCDSKAQCPVHIKCSGTACWIKKGMHDKECFKYMTEKSMKKLV